MSSPEFENRKLREKIEKLIATHKEEIKQFIDKVEYLEANSKDNYDTIYKLNGELDKVKKAEQDATSGLDTALKEIQNLKQKLEDQDKLRLQKEDELARNIQDQNEVAFKLKNNYDDICLKSQSALDDQKRETDEWKQKFEASQMLLKNKDTYISELNASFNKQSQKLQEEADVELNRLRTLLTEQQDKYEENMENYKTEIENLKEHLNFVKGINEGLSSKLDSEKNLFKQLSEDHAKESGKQNLEISQLKHELSKVEQGNTEKDKVIKELESTIKENRDFLYTDSEFDLIVAKIKSLRSENKKIKLENLKLLEENDKLTDDVVCLRRDLKDSEDEHDANDLVRENIKLKEINESLEVEKERLLRELVSKTYSFN